MCRMQSHGEDYQEKIGEAPREEWATSMNSGLFLDVNYIKSSKQYRRYLLQATHATSIDDVDTVRARAAVNTCHIKPLQNISQFFSYFQQTRYPCRNMTKFGGAKIRLGNLTFTDGDKWVCMDAQVAPRPSHCLVYSFGINNEWSFDDAMATYGCQVFSFDPTMAVGDHRRSHNVTFFRMGVGRVSGNGSRGKMDRLGGIVERLGHIGRKIDYLKMDIEKMEKETLEEVLEHQPEILAAVTQLSVEIHPGPYSGENVQRPFNSFYRFWRIFQYLSCLEFRLLYGNINPVAVNHYKWKGSQQSTCYEMVWVRLPS